MKALALAAIRFYQRFLSPYKGFRCAYAAYTSDASCSALGDRAIRRFGVWDGLAVLDRRLARCGTAHRIAHPARPAPLQRQAGDCDIGGCDGIGCDDLPSGKSSANCVSSAAEGALDCLSCDCDWRRRRQAGNTRVSRRTRAANEEAVRRRSRELRERIASRGGRNEPPATGDS